MFLQYLGLNLPQRVSSNSPHFFEQLERPQDFSNVIKALKELVVPMDMNEMDPMKDEIIAEMKTNVFDIHLFEKLSINKLEDGQQLDIIRHVLQRAKQIFKGNQNFNTQFSILLMLFESVHAPIEQSRTLAKAILQSDSMNLSLWNAYATIEQNNENFSEATRIFTKSLSLCPSLPQNVKPSLPILVKSFAEMEFENQKFDWEAKTLNILLTLSEENFTPIKSQKIKKGQPLPPTTVIPKERIQTGQQVSLSLSSEPKLPLPHRDFLPH